MTSSDLDLDAIEARANAATVCPEAKANGREDGQHTWGGSSFTSVQCELCQYTRPRGERAEEAAALVAEVRRLRADAAAELLPAWEAMYEPGNVSDYLIGYANDEAAAKGAAEAWLRSQKDEIGRLEWVPQRPLDGYDQEFELGERHDDGIDTASGITVRRRGVVPAASAPGTRCRTTEVLSIVSAWLAETDETGNANTAALAVRLRQAGFPLPDVEQDGGQQS